VRHRVRSAWLCAWACLGSALAHAAGDPLPPDVQASLRASGLPLSSFGFYARPVDGDASAALLALNAEQPFVMASTAKVVTSLAALDLLGANHRWNHRAQATGPVADGRLSGHLVLSGSGGGITPAELGRWFRQMHAEGVTRVNGDIVLDRLTLLHEQHPAQAATTAAESAPAVAGGSSAAAVPLTVSIRPSGGTRAQVAVRPLPRGVVVVNDVFMGDACSAWAQWSDTGGAASQIWVRGQWNPGCGARDVASVRVPATALRPATVAAPPARAVSTPALVAALWAESGGRLGGRVLEREQRDLPDRASNVAQHWGSRMSTPLPAVIREINKTSNNSAARRLLLSLSPRLPQPGGTLRAAQDRVHGWLRAQGLAEDDIRIDLGSGQSRDERGKPRALVQLLRNAWRANSSDIFIASLPIAGVDGTLAHRLRRGSAAGQAWLKTGTLNDTRALAGYVKGRSGKMYAVAALVNHPQAARATPTLDAFIEWVAKNG
jgi:D-alanyl-D-alanine carboxypeptidase/D-alanyl-D-alanine-endopeptidase (penicillin-binding protein 4)